MADGEGFARSALCGNRDDFGALSLPKSTACRTPVRVFFYPKPHETKIKRQKWRLIFVADGEGFEPPDELPRQRFSRPSHSTALPTILNSQYVRRSFKPAVLVLRMISSYSHLASQSRHRIRPRLPTILNASLQHFIVFFLKTQIIN